MQERRFDELTQTLGLATSRRQILKGLVGAVAAAALGGIGLRGPHPVTAADRPTCDGVPYNPAVQCCEPAGVQQRYPITNLDECPDRVPHPGHVPGFNGCGPENGFSRYLIPNKVGPWRNVDFTPACNNHDICYDTCNNDKATCDTNFFHDLSAACTAAYPGTGWYETYMRTACINLDARVYYLAVSRHGDSAYEDAQKQACDCCPACQDCNGLNDKCCGNQCVNPWTDHENCGDCGHACRSDQVCAEGTCQCPAGQVECSGVCVSLSSDPANCGACGQACRADEICADSVCKCPAGQTDCNGKCVDLLDDHDNCGVCGQSCGSDVCCDGACNSQCNCEPINCPPGETQDPTDCQCKPDCQCQPINGHPLICCVDDLGEGYCCFDTQTCTPNCHGVLCCTGPFPPGCNELGCSA